MRFETADGARSWKVAGAALALLVALGLVVMVLLGSQVSGVLSTVGASVGSPGSGGQEDGQVQPGDDQQGSDGGTGSGDGSGSADGSGSGDGSGSADGSGPNAVDLMDATRSDLLVVKTGEITLQVDDVDGAVNAATQAIDSLGGYASGSARGGAGAGQTAEITFRIPVAAWDRALVQLRQLGGTVLDEHAESDDVTAKVVDIDARVRNLRVTEAALQGIMTQAAAIKDVLTVQEQLTTVRGEIEELQSQASRMRDQAALSTLTLHFQRTPGPVVRAQEATFDPMTEADAATAHLVSVLQALAKVGIWFGIVWLPILISLSIVGGIGLFVYRRLTGRARAEVAGGA